MHVLKYGAGILSSVWWAYPHMLAGIYHTESMVKDFYKIKQSSARNMRYNCIAHSVIIAGISRMC